MRRSWSCTIHGVGILLLLLAPLPARAREVRFGQLAFTVPNTWKITNAGKGADKQLHITPAGFKGTAVIRVLPPAAARGLLPGQRVDSFLKRLRRGRKVLSLREAVEFESKKGLEGAHGGQTTRGRRHRVHHIKAYAFDVPGARIQLLYLKAVARRTFKALVPLLHRSMQGAKLNSTSKKSR